MSLIKKGDIVARKSHQKDIIFVVKNIIRTKENTIVILKGLVERIEVDSYIDDLVRVDKKYVKDKLKYVDYRMKTQIEQSINDKKIDGYKIGLVSGNNRNKEKIITGKILHLDGDKRYSEKSYMYYKKLRLNAVVKNISEYKQPKVVYQLLKIYTPDILVVTGHDGMIKRGREYNNIYNYRNSKYFIETVREARRYDRENRKNLVIFARSLSKLF